MEPQLTGQGTRLDETAPWHSYASEMEEKVSAELAEEIAEYAKHRYEDNQSSNQTKEELARQQEINRGIGKEYQFVTPEEYADVQQRTGRVMHSSVFITKLREIGVNCWYTQHPQLQKAVLMVYEGGSKPPQIACWVQQGFMPELSWVRFDDKGVPLDERRRGWRTCLLQLILKGIVTEEDADRTFGKPKLTEAFDRYNSTLYEFRSKGFSQED